MQTPRLLEQLLVEHSILELHAAPMFFVPPGLGAVTPVDGGVGQMPQDCLHLSLILVPHLSILLHLDIRFFAHSQFFHG